MEKRLIYRVRIVLSLMVFSILITACHTTNKLKEADNEDKVAMFILHKVIQSEPAIQSADIKRLTLSANLNGKKYTTPCSCRIIRDSVLFLSVQPAFGMEMFVLKADKEGLVILDKLKKQYYFMSYGQLSSVTGIETDFLQFQNILLNKYTVLNVFSAAKTPVKLMKNQEIVSGLMFENKDFVQKILLSDQYRIMRNEILSKSSNRNFKVLYVDNNQIDSVSFPMKFNIVFGNSSVENSLLFQINRIIINQPVSIPEINPENYIHGDIRSLLKF